MEAGIACRDVYVVPLGAECLLCHTFILTWYVLGAPRASPSIINGSVVHSFLILLTR